MPDSGSQDFARTVDTFTNSTGSSIETTVQIVANLGSNGATTVFATSDGDTTVDAGDQWIGTDGDGTPAIITYIDGPLSLQPTSVTLNGDDLQWTYSITVAAGASVNLAYFTIVATTPAAAVAEANALVTSSGFGGQAGAFLSTAELQSLANFANTSVALTPPPSPTEGAAIIDANLFHFTDTSANANINNYTATITWGDGAISTVTSTPSSDGQIVADPNGGYDVLGTHVYTEAILSPVTLSVQVTNGPGTIGASDTSLTVADAPLTAGALTPPAAAQAVGFSDVVVFHFSDANSYATAGDYSAVITWGDGTTATVTSTASGDGQIVADGGGFDVLGSHVYTQQLSDATFSVQVTDVGGSSTGASQSGFSVADAPLTAGSLTPPAATEGIGFSDALLFQFADADPGATAGEYTALITWGDGTTATVTSTASGDGQIVADGGGFDVLGSHVYTQQVSGATFSVQVTDVGGSTTGASQSGFSVADQPLLATGGFNVSFEQGQAIDPQTVVATFTDPGGAQAVGNYSASIDWGDGTAASQGILSLADGVFTVEGGHTLRRR